MTKKQFIFFLIFILIYIIYCAIGVFVPAPLFFKIVMFICYTALMLAISFIVCLLFF